MSHHALKIGSSVADRSGVLDASIGDLDDVTLAGAAGNEVLTYASASSDWRNVAASSVASNPTYAYLYFAKAASFGASRSYTAHTFNFQWRTASYTPLFGSGITDQNGVNTSWAQGVNVPAGSYLLMAQPMTNAGSGQSITWQWYDGSSFFGPKVYHQPTTAKGGAVATAVYTAAAATTLSLRVTSISASIQFAQQGGIRLVGIHITEL